MSSEPLVTVVGRESLLQFNNINREEISVRNSVGFQCQKGKYSPGIIVLRDREVVK